MESLSRSEVREKLKDQNVAVVEVLSPDTFEQFHLPNAINVPLDDEFDQKIQQAVPDKVRPVVVYCYDTECQASAKAAERMDALGYKSVFDYEAGKVDWREAGLPVER